MRSASGTVLRLGILGKVGRGSSCARVVGGEIVDETDGGLKA